MPEGPEARTSADHLQWVKGMTLTGCVISDGINGDQQQKLAPGLFTQIFSYGKKVILSLETNETKTLIHLVFELGMKGRFTYIPEKGTVISLGLSPSPGQTEGAERRSLYWGYTLPHGAAFHTFSTEELQKWLSRFGPDVLATEVSPSVWADIWRSRKIKNWNLCKALMDQTVIAGVGNYLKSEILYYAGLRPDRKVSSLTDAQIERLRVVTHHIIRVSYSYGGCTLESFISPDGSEGLYQVAVYGWIDSKVDIDGRGNKIERTKEFDNRTTSWCPAIQI